MPTTLSSKPIIDVPLWRPESPTVGVHAAGGCITSDLRNDATRIPALYFLRSAASLDVFDPIAGEWLPLASPALVGTFGAGAACVFHPAGPAGTLAAGGTTTTVVLNTALPASVAVNQLANRGDGVGFTIRIITGGRTEERTIIANTAGTTPTLTLSAALTSAPAAGDTYEMLSGRVFLLNAGASASGIWKYYDIATNSYATLSSSGLFATINLDSVLVALSELYVPSDRAPGSGFVSGAGTYNAAAPIQCIVGNGTTTTSITGQGMSAIRANEYRNFQVRIVEDTVTPTAVGQRRRIFDHTAGSAAAFTVATAWTVTPSSGAKFVIENDNDKIILRTSASTLLYNYNIAASTWDTSTWAAPVANGAGSVAAQSFGTVWDASGQARHSYIYFVRGGGTSSIDVLDIAGATTGAWTNAITYGKSNQTFTTGTSGCYLPATLGGRYLVLNVNGTQRQARFDLRNRTLDAYTYLRFPQGTAAVGNRMATTTFIDGATKLGFAYQLTTSQAWFFSVAAQV